MDKILLDNICKEVIDLLILKNKEYGNSFFKTIDIFGLKALAIRLHDKILRLINISKNNETEYYDTIIDIIGYSLLYLYNKKEHKETLYEFNPK